MDKISEACQTDFQKARDKAELATDMIQQALAVLMAGTPEMKQAKSLAAAREITRINDTRNEQIIKEVDKEIGKIRLALQAMADEIQLLNTINQ